ncbi:MAG: DNA/RNA non-specific endonuclease [candidate division Zixibacteria bacterium]|nr:DNA/RNA non-specific endonuclease [candidate division Zixibacteria bacterium]MDH3937563.1 DNA/RNA non-specific endonuclease [candidate division Zixibacteria bacterium]MDH4033711.1 DNA/RNA non-specific endonuclease [candidate division Zixibacteria bacterium]
MELPNLRRETIYGMPAADQIMFNRYYVLGYSYYFRQAKWALEIVDTANTEVERLDNFRSDYRIPEMFRADRVDYEGSGYHRGHLVASANQRETDLQNSETFLLSNMSPQKPNFNTGIWKELESEVRRLDKKSKILETFVICGPIFYFDKPVKSIGADDSNDVTIPVPNAYFKSVLAENKSGTLHMWSFVFPNEGTNKSLDSFLKPTTLVEKLAGIKLWERLTGKKIDKEKSKVRKMW